MSERTAAEAMLDFERMLDRMLADGPDRRLSDDVLQKMFTIAVRRFSRRYEEAPGLAPLLPEHVNATDVSTSCIEMLHVVDLEVFELTFWGSRHAAHRG
jgi:hypothetical protein